MATITTSFNIVAWQEDRSDQTTPRVTPAHVAFALPEVQGDVKAEYLMTYLPTGDAKFVFTDFVTVKNLNGKRGTFITQGKGTFSARTHSVEGSFILVNGAGTENFEHVGGEGRFTSAPKTQYEFTLGCIKADS